MVGVNDTLNLLPWSLAEGVAMNEPSVLLRYMDIFHPIDAQEGSDTYAHFAEAARGVTEELGCEDGQRSHFEVRYGGRTFYVLSRTQSRAPR